MAVPGVLDWPFFDDGHRRFAQEFEAWSAGLGPEPEGDLEAATRASVRELGVAGWLRPVVAASDGGPRQLIDIRTLCLARERAAARSGFVDAALAMQGLGSMPISIAGTPDLRRRYLPGTAAGDLVAAFALSEREAGSDVASLSTTAVRDGGDWVLEGEKTWISNAGVADYYVVFARTGEQPGSRGISAFVVDADSPGMDVTERIPVIAPHPLGTIRFDGCRVPGDRLVGEAGRGFALAMQTLDAFRPTVGAAALGIAGRALDEAADRVVERRQFGRPLADHQLVKGLISGMAIDVDTSALLVYRAAWVHDVGGGRATREASMAKLHATEAAQRVVDAAVQLFGGLGVVRGEVPERLYREVRALRIYEGTTQIQQLIVADRVLAARMAAMEAMEVTQGDD